MLNILEFALFNFNMDIGLKKIDKTNTFSNNQLYKNHFIIKQDNHMQLKFTIEVQCMLIKNLNWLQL